MAQFTCSVCGDGFEQKSRLRRHMDTAHPPQAPSAADVEKVLAGIDYPKTKDDLVECSSQKASTISKDLFDLIKSLPSRTYRDSAEVAVALGELKSGKKVREAEQAEAIEQPSKRGGRAAATSSATSSVSAAAIAKLLAGIDFKSKSSLKSYAKRNKAKINYSDPNENEILNILNRLPDKEYRNMADVEKSVGSSI
jgi:Protein of unknown function (DUF2795)